jgi:hypothetical protein
LLPSSLAHRSPFKISATNELQDGSDIGRPIISLTKGALQMEGSQEIHHRLALIDTYLIIKLYSSGCPRRYPPSACQRLVQNACQIINSALGEAQVVFLRASLPPS